jgi:hypothetical protein
MGSPQLIWRSGYARVFRYAGVVFWTGKASICGDGAVRCYHPVSSKGLDALSNAGRPGQWWGIATANGKPSGRPCVQTLSDPAPGFFVSTTALQDWSKRLCDPHRYVDAATIPYFVMPGGHTFGAKLGDLGLLVNASTGKHVVAIYADVGPHDDLGEISIAAAAALGIPSSPRTGGVGGGIVYAVFPGLPSMWPRLTYPNAHWTTGINDCVKALGGFSVIKRTLDIA